MNNIMKKYRNILVASFIAAASVMAVSCLKDEEFYQDEQGVSTSRGTIVLPYNLPTYDVELYYRDNHWYRHLLSLEATNPATLPDAIGSDHPTAGGGIYTERMDTISSTNYIYDHTLKIHYDNVPEGAHSVILHCPYVVNKGGNKNYYDYRLHISVPIINLDTTIINEFEEDGGGYDYHFDFTVPNYKD